MPKSRKFADPFAVRESENYKNPIPSREFILNHLEEHGVPLTYLELCDHLDIKTDEREEALRRRLIAMRRDGQVISNRKGAYGLSDHMELKKGTVQGTKDGVGYFVPSSGGDDLFLGLREMEKLFDGDQVLARFNGLDSRGRREGVVVEILERRYKEIVGRFYAEQGYGLVIADNKRIAHEILIPERECRNAGDGQFVVAELIEYPSKRRKAIGRVTEILGDITTPGLEIDVAVRSFNIPHNWPEAVNGEIGKIEKHVREEDKRDKFDLRDLPFVTIDGEDAKDFDDAIYAHKHQRGNWTLYVAIADVSHYVKVGSALDQEASDRGTSVYFPGHVIPMLPEELSNGLCSLKPKVDRLAMLCEMEISKDGDLLDYCFYEALIHSHARMTYTEVADILRKPNTSAEEKLQSKLQNKHSALLLQFDNLNSLFYALRIAREKSGAMDFQSTETRLIFGEDKKLKEIVPVERNDAHRMIEECMLCANIAAARLIEGFKLPALFRTHEGPNPEKLENVREFLSGLGLYLGGGEKPAPSDYAKVLLAASSRPDSRLLNTMLIRSMMQAVYQADNIGHFGLGFSAYTHFTSPIRRYPDLLVHRAIKYLIHNKSSAHLKRKTPLKTVSKQAIYPYTEAEINSLGVACSESERRADSAGYSVLDWFKCEYMQERVGDEFLGTITTVMSFGLFVELDNIYIEGLVHISELSNDYYHFDPVNHCLEGERTRKIYRLGDKIDVRVVRVDLEEKKIDLQIKGLPDKSNSKIKNQRRTKKDPSVRGSKSKKKNTQQSGEKNKKSKKKNVNSKKRLVSGRSSTEKKKIKKRSRKSASKLSKKSH